MKHRLKAAINHISGIVGKLRLFLCLFLLCLLSGCYKQLSFTEERERARQLAKEFTSEDITYLKEGCVPELEAFPQELSRDAAIRIALLNNKDLQASLYELGIEKMNLADALLLRNPLVAIAEGDPINESTLKVLAVRTEIFNIPDLFQIPLKKKVYSTQLEIAIYTFVTKMVEIIAQTRQAYDKALFTYALIDVADRSLAMKKGADTESVESIAGEIEKLSSMKELIVALAELRVLLGVSKETFAGVKLSTGLAESMTPLPSLDDLMQWAECSHIAIVLAQKRIHYARELLAYEESKVFDHFSVGAAYFRVINAQSKQTGVGPYIVAEVPLFHQNQPRREQARYSIEKYRREYDDKLTKLKASLCTAYEKIIVQKKIIGLYEKELLLLHKDDKKGAYNEIVLKRLEAHYQLLELYTDFERICGKRIFFSVPRCIPPCFATT